MKASRRCAFLITSAALLAATPLLAQAQIVPATQPMQEMETPAATRPATEPTTQPVVKFIFNFKDTPIDDVLTYLSAQAHLTVVKTTVVTSRVTVINNYPVTPEVAIQDLNTLLKPYYAAVLKGNVLEIMTMADAIGGAIPVYIGDDPDLIIPDDELVTQVMPLKNIDATRAQRDLQPLVSTSAVLTSNAGSNSLVMTDHRANIQRIAKIVQSMDDRSQLSSAVLVKALKYADATATAKLVTDIFAPPPTTNGANGAAPGNGATNLTGGRGGAAGGGRGGGAAGGGHAGGGGATGGPANAGLGPDTSGQQARVIADADTRTNSVVITAPQDLLDLIDKTILTPLDKDPALDSTFFTYKVKNGVAADMASTLNQLFGGSNTGVVTRTQTSNALAFSSGGLSSGSSIGGGGARGGGGGARGGGAAGGGAAGGRGGGIGGATGFGAAGGSGSNPNGNVLSDLIGQVYVVADVDTNQLLIATSTKIIDKVQATIETLDRPIPQVLIKCLIADVQHSSNNDFGTDFSVLNMRSATKGQNLSSNTAYAPVTSAQTNGPVQGFTSDVGAVLDGTQFAAPQSGLAVQVLENNLVTTFHALAEQGKVDVLSRPYILTSDNQEAIITVGQYVPLITSSSIDTTNNSIINSVTYQNVGVILDVLPHVNPDGLVVMTVAPQVSQIDPTITVQLSQGVTSPVFDNKSAETNVSINDGETIVIGGMMSDVRNANINRIPIVGDLPLIGPLLGDNSNSKTKEELLVFLTPHVAMVPDVLQKMTNSGDTELKLLPTWNLFLDHIKGLSLGSATRPSIPAYVPPPPPNMQGEDKDFGN